MIVKIASIASMIGSKALDVGASFNPIGHLKSPINLMLGANIHDLPHFAFGKSNKFGKFFQKATIADAIVAAKNGMDGKVYANRKPLGLALYGLEPMKAMAMHEANLAGGALPKIIGSGYKVGKHQIGGMFRGNKLDTELVKKSLTQANRIDRLAFSAQVGLPTIAGGKEYQLQKERGADTKTAVKAGLKAGLTNAAIVAPLIAIPRSMFLHPAAQIHKTLSKDGNYGYGLLEDAAVAAEKTMNRPTMFNYSKALYTTPERNAKGILGKVYGDSLKRLFGQKVIKGHKKNVGYVYHGTPEAEDETPLKWGVGKAKRTINRIDNILSGNLGK